MTRHDRQTDRKTDRRTDGQTGRQVCLLTICAIYELSSEVPNKKIGPVWDSTHSIHSCSYHGRQVACQMPADNVRVINAQCQRVKFHNQLMTKACNQLCIGRQSDLSKPISLTHSLTHSLTGLCLLNKTPKGHHPTERNYYVLRQTTM